MKKNILIHLILPIFAFLLFTYALVTTFSPQAKRTLVQIVPPPSSPYEHRVGGIGITEPQSESISLSTNISGIITKIYVVASQKVKAGDPVFTIDDRDANAQLAVAMAKRDVAKIQSLDAKQQLSFYERITDKRAISKEELSKRKYASQMAEKQVKEAEANILTIKTLLDRLTVKAPVHGEILRVNIRLGEYAQVGNDVMPPIILGNTEVMHVRVEVDETDTRRILPNMRAIGFIRGSVKTPVDLKFVRVEPFLVPKKSLTGDGTERIDTRVQQVIYSFDNKIAKAFVGQQMDVFIEAPANGNGHSKETK